MINKKQLEDKEDYLLALEIYERVKTGKERIYSLDEVEKEFEDEGK